MQVKDLMARLSFCDQDSEVIIVIECTTASIEAVLSISKETVAIVDAASVE